MKFILLISLFFVSNLSIGQIEKNTSSLWDEIRQRSELPYDPSRSEIQKSTLRYDSNQYVVNRLSKNGQRYLYYTVSQGS